MKRRIIINEIKPRCIRGNVYFRRKIISGIQAFIRVGKMLCKALHKLFRILKTDLDLRPVYHKTDAAAMAHLHLGLLAYWVVNTVPISSNKRVSTTYGLIL